MIVAADVGGTFTDLVAVTDQGITTGKTPTTVDQSEGVALGLDDLRSGHTADAFIHGTTVATNALLERAGATTALITDAGFEDVIEIGRQDRPSLYDAFDDRPPPLVQRRHRLGIDSGQDAAPVLPDGIEALAIVLVDGHADREREQGVGRAIRDSHPGLPISLSSEVAPEFREFERTSTSVLNAYLTPITSAYLERLDDAIVGAGRANSLSVMRSSGGLMAVPDAARLPVAVLLSGPAGGVVAAEAVARRLDLDSVISFDMGGTSTDVCRIDERGIDVTYERDIDGYACRMPSVGIHTVGAGGGSIAWVDPGGALRVGPQSAGAIPGPAAYGHGGTKPTVTDANVILGRLDPGMVLGESVRLDVEAARRAITAVAHEAGLDAVQAAVGTTRIAEEIMAGAVRTVSVEQGADPRSSHLMAFGGAGGLHAVAVARSLGMRGVIVPVHAGVFSALGLVLSAPRAESVEAVHVREDDATLLASAIERVRRASIAELASAGHDATEVAVLVDARYVGQSHEIAVPYVHGEAYTDLSDRFHAAHIAMRGYERRSDPVELVAVRCVATGTPPATIDDVVAPQPVEHPITRRPVLDSTGSVLDASVVRREGLSIGSVVDGPVVIEEANATTWVEPGCQATVLGDGSIEVSW